MKPNHTASQKDGYLVIVEDDADDRTLLQQVFVEMNWDHHVRILEDSDTLLDLLDATQYHSQLPSLIVLDYNMPTLSGESTLLILKESERYKHIPVSIYSTLMNKRKEMLLQVLGAVSCRQKPVSLQGLKALMFEYKTMAQQQWFASRQRGVFL